MPNIESIWMVIVAVSAPVAGVLAFYIQLKNVKKLNLENEKLNFEISKLKREKEKLESKIHIPTNEEVEKYSANHQILFSCSPNHETEKKTLIQRFTEFDWWLLFLSFLIVIFMGYFFYDVYRVGLWFFNLF